MFGLATFEPGKSFQSIMMGGLLSLTVVMVLLPSVVTDPISLSGPTVNTDVLSLLSSVIVPLITVMLLLFRAGFPLYCPPLIVVGTFPLRVILLFTLLITTCVAFSMLCKLYTVCDVSVGLHVITRVSSGVST